MLAEIGALCVSLAVFRWWITKEKHPNNPHFTPGVELQKDGPFYIVNFGPNLLNDVEFRLEIDKFRATFRFYFSWRF